MKKFLTINKNQYGIVGHLSPAPQARLKNFKIKAKRSIDWTGTIRWETKKMVHIYIKLNFNISFAWNVMQMCHSYKFEWERSETQSTFKKSCLSKISWQSATVLQTIPSHRLVDCKAIYLKGISHEVEEKTKNKINIIICYAYDFGYGMIMN